mmetsp:Transcript_23426/g.73818  ORF Transcript_23426/g.73818 Transcript_23426/m.73818 type:complete len:89 (+) Transcript_23426:1820-2086(+)
MPSPSSPAAAPGGATRPEASTALPRRLDAAGAAAADDDDLEDPPACLELPGLRTGHRWASARQAAPREPLLGGEPRDILPARAGGSFA